MSLRKQFAVALLAGLGALHAASGTASAQVKFDAQIPTPPTYKDAGTTFRAAVKETGTLSQASKDAIKVYAENFMGALTRELPDKAHNNVQLMLNQISSADGKSTAATAIASMATRIINGNYPPAVKINAMLCLIEADDMNRLAAPETFGAIATYCVSPNVPAHLRSLALVGLERHVKAKRLDAARLNKVVQSMVTIIGSKPTAIQEEKAHWWMVRRAYDTMFAIHTVNPDLKQVPAIGDCMKQSLDMFMEPTTVPSVRLAAGQFLTRFDLSAAGEVVKYKLLVATAQMLDQEVVGWYEQENEKNKMASGMSGMGGMMGGMGMGGGMPGEGGGMGMGGMGGSDGGAGMGMGMGMPGEGGGGGFGQGNMGPKPVDVQKWDLRLARRKLNTYCQLAYVLLKGIAAEKERDFSPTGKGLMEAELPAELQRPGKLLVEALDKVQKEINERSLVTVQSLMSRTVYSLQTLRDAAEEIPGKKDENGNVLAPSFAELSPRMKSFKKVDASGSLDAPAAAPADGAPADGAPAATAPADGAPAPAAGAPANGGAAPAVPAAAPNGVPAAAGAAAPAPAAAAPAATTPATAP